MESYRRLLLALLGGALLCQGPGLASARTIAVTPADDFRVIEAAQSGDVVEIAPGTYRFRVSFTSSGTAERPIIIRAKDPTQRPLWDLTGTPVSSAPGSYTAGDRGRGCWQMRGGHYRIEGIAFRGCVDHGSAAIRVVNVPGVHIRDCLFVGNTNGVTGAGEDLRIEFSEFDKNGAALPGDAPAHSIYIYGGTLKVHYSYFHDSPAGQHFHIRSRDSVLAYNWFTRPGSYPGDLMTCDYQCGGRAGEAITQRMLLLGNVIVQGSPANGSQILALYKDSAGSADKTGDAGTFELTLSHNTIIGTPRAPGQTHRLVNMRNDGAAVHVRADNNIVTRVAAFTEAAQPNGTNYSVAGGGNWVTTGTNVTGLTGTKMGTDPLLSAAYVPRAGSPVLGLAAPGQASPPTFEYYRDEQVKLMGRARAATRDSGAFESSNMGAPFGPREEPAPPMTDGGGTIDGGSGGDGGGEEADGGTAPGEEPGGCSCHVSGADRGGVGAWVLLGLLALLRRRRR